MTVAAPPTRFSTGWYFQVVTTTAGNLPFTTPDQYRSSLATHSVVTNPDRFYPGEVGVYEVQAQFDGRVGPTTPRILAIKKTDGAAVTTTVATNESNTNFTLTVTADTVVSDTATYFTVWYQGSAPASGNACLQFQYRRVA